MKRMVALALCSALPAGLGCPAWESPDLPATVTALERAIEAARAAENVPGAAVAVVRNDTVILLKGFGLRDVEAGLLVTPQTIFATGSCTKTFTAVAAVISADQNVLSLDDSPKRFLPYFELRDPEADARVALRDLLSHRTGVPDCLAAGWFERYPTHEELIRAAMQCEQTARLRERFQYNNYMYLAAGEALAAAHRSSYEDVIARLVLEPLDMRSSRLSAPAAQSADVSRGYDEERRALPPESLAYLAGIAPAAALSSNAEDMTRWLRMLLGGGMIDGKRIVSERGFQELLSEHVRTQGGHHGLGLFIEEWRGRRSWFGSGGVLGFGSRFEFMPDQGLGVVVLTNFDDQKLPKRIRDLVYESLVTNP